MANDTLDPDSASAELPGETEVADSDATPDGTIDAADAGNEQVAKGGKEKALSDTERALKERQADFTRLSQQYAEMKGKMDLMIQMQAQSKPQEEAKDWLDEFTDDDLVENPAKAKDLIRRSRQEIAQVLRDRDEYWKQEIAKTTGSRVDPELASAMNELRNDPDLANLPDTALKAMATRLMKSNGKKLAVRTPTGNILPSRSGSSGRQDDGEMTAEQKLYLQISGTDRGGKRTDTLE